MLDTGMNAVRDRLADLAGASWMMSMPQLQAAYTGHPAGRGRPGFSADDGTGLVAVTFGSLAAPATDHVVLPVCWEPVEPGDKCTVQLSGSITLAPAGSRERSALTMSGTYQTAAAALSTECCEQLRPQLIEASREFITSVARDVIRATGRDPEHDLLGPVWAW
jgi:hypothetical protein